MNNEIIFKPVEIKVKSATFSDRNKLIKTLENLEMQTIDLEKETRIDVAKCEPSKLFNLIATASFYRATAGHAEELYPGELDIEEHVKSSKRLLTERAIELTMRFEKECKCKPK